ncbi:uncharacterized protein G2W53_011489 [Senna tora]|uniref:Uncharacterized protein n=1 Tax=Senna tora TaxID=362788 RepID=A0A834X1D7_9FABA|nr:uncharacterized protein G2W53_011489 [Senna tora]
MEEDRDEEENSKEFGSVKQEQTSPKCKHT